MVSIKALVTGLAGVSLCLANIIGTVTDTGTTPIPNAVVQLETGGQIDTTDADGNFTLVVSSAVLTGKSTVSANGLSAGISGNMLKVTIAGQSAVEVTTFDLCGKSLSTVRKALCAGSHSIALPYNGHGIYLYKVKAGNNELVLKGNAVDGVSSGNVVSSQISSSKVLVKQAKTHSATDDVIAVTKEDYLNYRCVIGNSDTSGLVIKMIANAGNVTDADGNVYQSVRIGNQVWMAENLRVTKYNDGSAITLDTSTETWGADTGEKYCNYDNTTNADSIRKYGALYNWYAVNTGKLAPAGWHVPTDAEWDTLQNYLIANGYNWDGTTTADKIAKSLAAKTDWYNSSTEGTIGYDLTKNNSSGFSALPGGYRYLDGSFVDQCYFGDWWSATEYAASLAYVRDLYYGYDGLYGLSINVESCGFSVRLLRDN